jgi:DNA-binding winged helix-turn-helix (wHTH) protein
VTTSRRYRFAEFVLSPRRRVLWRHGEPLAIIPKYFDLLLFLVEHRRDAVSKQTIFSRVWSEVIVSDGALSQAVRVLRRTLGDDAREPRFIRTVPRHGYQFVWTETVEEVDDGTAGRGEIPGTETGAPVGTAPPPTTATRLDAAPVPTLDALVDELIALAATDRGGDQARDLAERLHARGTAEALAILRARPGHSSALALMRDARWTIPGAGPVPLLTEPGGPAAAAALIRLRLGDAGRIVSARWAGAAWAGTWVASRSWCRRHRIASRR